MPTKKSVEELLKELPPNATMRDIFDFCKRNDIDSLAQGMIELPPPLKLRQLAADMCVAESEIHQYRNRFGEDDYRDALATLQSKRYRSPHVTKDCILATAGVTGVLVSVLMHLKNLKGGAQNVLGPALMVPFYTYHAKQITDVLGKEPVFVNSKEDFSPDWDEVNKALLQGPGIDLLIVTNPGNPAGNIWKEADLKKLIDLTSRSGCLLLLDEIYCDLVWRGDFWSPTQEEELHKHVLVARGFAKSLAAQSWRCGYAVGHPQMIDQLMKIHDPIYISVPWVQHAIGRYLAKHYEDFDLHIKETSKLMQDNWALLAPIMQKALGWTPINPDGSMYGLFLHHKSSDEEAIAQGLAKGVGVAPGSIFWPNNPKNTGYVRIHCGVSSEKAHKIAEAIQQG